MGEKVPEATASENAPLIDQALLPILRRVKDPELPQVDIVGLGLIRRAELSPEGLVEVVLTPTYSGCPALRVMEEEIIRVLSDRGYDQVKIILQYDPPWSSDWIDEESRMLLKAGGVAPPQRPVESLVRIGSLSVPCPFCESRKTILKSEFGSTACKAMYFCDACQQPFELFKTSRG